MAESTRPGEGGLQCSGSFPELKERSVDASTGLVLTSMTANTLLPLFYDANHDAIITDIFLLYTTTATGSAKSLNIGVTGNASGCVSGEAISTTATAGTVQVLTLNSAGLANTGPAAGYYRVPAGTVLNASSSAGSNNGRAIFRTKYVLLDRWVGS